MYIEVKRKCKKIGIWKYLKLFKLHPSDKTEKASAIFRTYEKFLHSCFIYFEICTLLNTNAVIFSKKTYFWNMFLLLFFKWLYELICLDFFQVCNLKMAFKCQGMPFYFHVHKFNFTVKPINKLKIYQKYYFKHDSSKQKTENKNKEKLNKVWFKNCIKWLQRFALLCFSQIYFIFFSSCNRGTLTIFHKIWFKNLLNFVFSLSF